MYDLGYRNIIVGIDLQAAFQEINNPQTWPGYCHLLIKISNLCLGFI
ncbi:unnamed protein product [Brassica oleracea var. botrytis]